MRRKGRCGCNALAAWFGCTAAASAASLCSSAKSWTLLASSARFPSSGVVGSSDKQDRRQEDRAHRGAVHQAALAARAAIRAWESTLRGNNGS